MPTGKPTLILRMAIGILAVAAILVAPAASAQNRHRGPGGPPGQNRPQEATEPSTRTAPARDTPMQSEATEAEADALLDDQLVIDPARLEAAKARLTRDPPSTDDHAQLARFFAERGDAARLLGNRQQSVQDWRKAVEHAGKTSGEVDYVLMLLRLVAVESLVGNRREAVRIAAQAVKAAPDHRRPQKALANATLAMTQIAIGHVDEAAAAVAEAQSIVADLKTRSRNPNALRATAATLGATAAVQEYRGLLTEAEANRRQGIADLRAAAQPGELSRLMNAQLALAANLRLQGRLGEAETLARQALADAQGRFGVASRPTASALQGLALILSDQGRGAEAEGLVRRAMEIVRGTGQSGLGTIQLVLANILAGQERWQDAASLYDAMREHTSRHPEDFDELTRRNLMLPLTLMKVGRVAEAEPRLARMLDAAKAALGADHYVTNETLGFLAMAHAAQGQEEQALAEFAAATTALLSRVRENGDGEEEAVAGAQNRRLRTVLEAYIDLLAATRGRSPARVDPVAESFRLAEVARSSSVLQALAAAAARSAADDQALAQAVRHLQDLDKQVSALNGLLGNAISARAAERDEGTIADLRRRIDTLRRNRGKLARELEQRFPDYARLVNPAPATPADIQRVLAADQVLIALHVGAKQTQVWAVPAQGPATMATAPIGREAIETLVAGVRRALDSPARTIAELPPFDTDAAHQIYAKLLAPVAATWQGAKTLLIVPDGALGQLPFGLLLTRPVPPGADQGNLPFTRYRNLPWLIRDIAITQLPSATSLTTLRAEIAPSGRRTFVGFGDPWFNRDQANTAPSSPADLPSGALPTRSALALRGDQAASGSADIARLPRLPDTAEEVRAIAAALHAEPGRDVFIGRQASVSTLKGLNLSQVRILMFATHGLLPGDLADLNEPALALSAADVTGNASDGLLTVGHIMALRLNADWVVLSACNTAAGNGAGAEAVSGLGRAFFYAGARALLVSNWPVESRSARLLTTDLFRRLAENPALPRTQALRQAALAMIDGTTAVDANGRPTFAYAHPLFWAPFSLVGDGDGNGVGAAKAR